MVVSAFQQHGIAEPVAQAQVDTNRRIHIRQHFLNLCIDGDLLHAKTKKPRLSGAPEYNYKS